MRQHTTVATRTRHAGACAPHQQRAAVALRAASAARPPADATTPQQQQHVASIASAADATPQQQEHPLFRWAAAHGAILHPSLIVTDHAPCGCRGVVTTADISASSRPLVAVPEALCMRSEDALQLLSQALDAPPGSRPVTKQQSATTTSSSSSATTTSEEATQSLLQRALGRLLNHATGQKVGVLQQRLRQLQPPMLLALLLAHQRRLGTESYWEPYVSCLPDRPPCAWYDAVEQQLTQQQGAPATAAASNSLSDAAASAASAEAVDPSAFAAAVAAVTAKCNAAAAVFGAALGGLTASELAWAYGQVVSRVFEEAGTGGGPTGLALLPVIDMLNHAAGAAVPVCWQAPQDGEEQQPLVQGAAGGDAYWCVWPELLADLSAAEGVASSVGGESETESGADEQVLLLRAGEELHISYMSTCDAAAAYLSFGFVPPELMS